MVPEHVIFARVPVYAGRWVAFCVFCGIMSKIFANIPMIFRRPQDTGTPLLVTWFGPTVGAVAMFLLEIVQIIAIALAIILPVRYFLIQPFVVKGASMEPNFYDSEYLIIDELSHRFRTPERGEVVVFHPPKNDELYYIKRVIGLPGETVEIKDNTVTIYNDTHPNGIKLDETYIGVVTDGELRKEVPEGHYFLMGDNRIASVDSRMFGTVPLHGDEMTGDIIGRVWVRGFPLDRMATFALPTYNF